MGTSLSHGEWFPAHPIQSPVTRTSTVSVPWSTGAARPVVSSARNEANGAMAAGSRVTVNSTSRALYATSRRGNTEARSACSIRPDSVWGASERLDVQRPALNDADKGDRFGDGRAVGTNQSAGAKFGAAEVAGDHGQDIGKFPVAENLQHGDAGGTRRLAIIARSLQTALGSDAPGRTDVTGIPISLAGRIDRQARLLLAGRPHQAAHEP